MTSSIFHGFYFRGSRSVCENRENSHPGKISRYTVLQLPMYQHTNINESGYSDVVHSFGVL